MSLILEPHCLLSLQRCPCQCIMLLQKIILPFHHFKHPILPPLLREANPSFQDFLWKQTQDCLVFRNRNGNRTGMWVNHNPIPVRMRFDFHNNQFSIPILLLQKNTPSTHEWVSTVFISNSPLFQLAFPTWPKFAFSSSTSPSVLYANYVLHKFV